VIILKVGFQNTAQMFLSQNNDVIEALASDWADQSFDIRILPRTSGRRHYSLNSHSSDSPAELFTEYLISISTVWTDWLAAVDIGIKANIFIGKFTITDIAHTPY
jgi:hypothetical protein